MTDPTNAGNPGASPADVPPDVPVASRKLKIALAVSVAINLAVAGLVAGMWLHGGPGSHGEMLVRDLGFGPFDAALLPNDREALRKTIQSHFGDVDATRQQMQADSATILTALRADPFDAAALATALDAQGQHLIDRMKFGTGIVRDYLASLTKDARLAFADRLEARLRRGHGGDAKDSTVAPAK